VLRGFAEGLDGNAAADGAALERALRAAEEAAYGALSQPKEGTILTVAREAAAAVEDSAPATAHEALAIAARAAFDAVERTPELLPVLKEAGVVDAGGLGLAIILEGIRRSVHGESLDVNLAPNVDLDGARRADAAALHRAEHGESGYCTEFLVAGSELDPAEVRERLNSMGTSVLVVGQPDLLRVHLHTLEPNEALAYGRTAGELLQTKVDNLEEQIDSFTETRDGGAGQASAISVVAVVSGRGLEEAFRSIGVDVLVEGGQTMNPSAGDILQAIESCRSDDVVVLPNNKNIVATAEQAARESSKRVVVVPSRSVPQGIAAALTLNPDLPMPENGSLMERSLSSVRSGEVTRAVRSTTLNGRDVRVGDAIGLVDGELRVVATSVEQAVADTVEGMIFDGASLLTLYAGRDTRGDDATALGEALRGQQTTLEVEVIRGDQPHYPYLISLE
jgi:hypothetical protein